MLLAMSESKNYGTASALARGIGCTPQAVGNVITGKTGALNQKNHTKACSLLCVFPEWLSTGLGRMRPGALLDDHSLPDPPSIDYMIEAISKASERLTPIGKAKALAYIDELIQEQTQKQDKLSA